MNVIKINKDGKIINKKGKTLREWLAKNQQLKDSDGIYKCFIGGKMKSWTGENGDYIYVLKEAAFSTKGDTAERLSDWFYKISYNCFAGITSMEGL